jgi:hypothetical protein
MAERKAIPKKVRFEVLKRDKFTCQYCGRQAPDVVLNIDHITPVAKGGTNDITNLITSCFDCNSGKSDRELSDDAAVKKQKAQLDLLQERREQLEMMHEWQMQLTDEALSAGKIVSDVCRKMTGAGLSEAGIRSANKLVSDFGLDEVCEAVRIAFSKYPHGTDKEWESAFGKIGGICYVRTHKTCYQCKKYMGRDGKRHECSKWTFYTIKEAETCDDFEAKDE